MNENKQEQITQCFNYTISILNSISVVGVENCQKINAIYNNIDVFLNMINNGEIQIISPCSDNKKQDKN